jgi:hypothetical protein
MAHSIQVVGDRHEVFEDMDLLVVLGLLLEELSERPERYARLARLRDVWTECRTGFGPGTIDLELDEVAAHPASKNELLDLLAATEGRLSSYDAVIPGHVLNAQCGVRGVYFNDFPTDRVAESIQRLVQML